MEATPPQVGTITLQSASRNIATTFDIVSFRFEMTLPTSIHMGGGGGAGKPEIGQLEFELLPTSGAAGIQEAVHFSPLDLNVALTLPNPGAGPSQPLLVSTQAFVAAVESRPARNPNQLSRLHVAMELANFTMREGAHQVSYDVALNTSVCGSTPCGCSNPVAPRFIQNNGQSVSTPPGTYLSDFYGVGGSNVVSITSTGTLTGKPSSSPLVVQRAMGEDLLCDVALVVRGGPYYPELEVSNVADVSASTPSPAFDHVVRATCGVLPSSVAVFSDANGDAKVKTAYEMGGVEHTYNDFDPATGALVASDSFFWNYTFNSTSGCP